MTHQQQLRTKKTRTRKESLFSIHVMDDYLEIHVVEGITEVLRLMLFLRVVVVAGALLTKVLRHAVA